MEGWGWWLDVVSCQRIQAGREQSVDKRTEAVIAYKKKKKEQ
jgi:hypothetical protein